MRNGRLFACSLLVLDLLAGCQTRRGTHVTSAFDEWIIAGDRNIIVQLKNAHTTWTGWGSSLAWWANTVGLTSYSESYADLFYGLGDVPFLGKTVPGLGLNVVRYNIGGSGSPGDGTSEVVSPALVPFRKISGFWPLDQAPQQQSASARWERDASQRHMLQLAIARGADQVEFFANSPMWWMMDSNSADGGQLRSDKVDDYTSYLAAVVDYAARSWQIHATSLAPFNEPTASWWDYPKDQEGASIPLEMHPGVLTSLRQKLDALGQTQTILAAADENSAEDAFYTLKAYNINSTTFNQQTVPVSALIKKVNVHGYFFGVNPQRDNYGRHLLREEAGSLPVWVSEYGDSDGSGQTLATSIMEDLYYLKPAAWVYWQPTEANKDWGFVQGDLMGSGTSQGEPLGINTKYYTMATFTRFIRPGFKLFDSPDGNTVVAYDASKQTLNLVALVGPSPQKVVYDLSQLRGVPAQAQLTMTSFDGKKLLETSSVAVNQGKIVLDAGGAGVYALTLTGVSGG